MLEQVIDLIDAWWSNIRQKQTLMCILTTIPDAGYTNNDTLPKLGQRHIGF